MEQTGRTGSAREEAATAKAPVPLGYGVALAGASARTWAWTFLLAGAYALACVPAVFLFEHLGWSDDPLHVTSQLACIICVVGAVQYLRVSRREDDHSARRRTIRLLAWLAVVLTCGFLVLCVVAALLFAIAMSDF